MPIAFFDMDYTLLRKSSSNLYVQYLARRRMISLREAVGVMVVTLKYSLNVLDFPKATSQLSRYIRGGDAAATKALCDDWVRNEVVNYIAPKALARLREHEQRGDAVVLISASTQFVVKPMADYLGIEYSCTELEIAPTGKFSGRIVDAACYGDGKRIWGERIAARKGAPLAECWFYTDSYSDRPLMDAVGHPVAINPDSKLRAYAASKGWPIENFY